MTNNVRGGTATNGQDACIEKQFDKKAQQGVVKLRNMSHAPGIKHNVEELRLARQIASILGKSSLVRFL